MKPTWYDWLVYRLFYRRWNRIFQANPPLFHRFKELMNAWAYEDTVKQARKWFE